MSTTNPKILVVAERDDRELVSRALENEHYDVLHASSTDELSHRLDQPIDLVVCDPGVPGAHCYELMRRWHEVRPTTQFVMLVDSGSVIDAIEAMKHGAADYITKPVNGDELLVRVDKWLESSRKEERLQQLESRLDHSHADNHRNGSGIDIPAGTSLEELERAAVERALTQHSGNRTHAAKTLGISVRTLQRKLKAWRVPVFALQHQRARQDFSMSGMG